MPRPLNKLTCNTCRRRKLRCSQHVPICDQCRTSRRYCDRSTRPVNIVEYESTPTGDTNPKELLRRPRIAQLFHSYIVNIAPWYDLSDAAKCFSGSVPGIALAELLLFYAVIALSAMHESKTSAGSSYSIASAYHTNCVRLLISLEGNDALVTRGIALAATCLLRSYEILDGDADPNMHLRGAYSMASITGMIAGEGGEDDDSRELLESGFWNYLREDITFSLFERCPLKMDLQAESMRLSPACRSDEDYLNTITLLLGRIINDAFSSCPNSERLVSYSEELGSWFHKLPERLMPYAMGSETSNADLGLPTFWCLRPCHASTLHYYLISLCILAFHLPTHLIKSSLVPLARLGYEAIPSTEILDQLATDICGIAFTAKTPSVIVNALGPIAYAGRFIKSRHIRDELERQLIASKRIIGWPVGRLIKDLNQVWATEARETSSS